VTPEFEQLDAEVAFRGKIITAGTERFRHEDGEEVTRDKVWHPGAVGILPVDQEHVWLTRQPREAAGLPAARVRDILDACRATVSLESPVGDALVRIDLREQPCGEVDHGPCLPRSRTGSHGAP